MLIVLRCSYGMSKFHTQINQWGLVSGIRQPQGDMIVVADPRSPFSPQTRKGQLFIVVVSCRVSCPDNEVNLIL